MNFLSILFPLTTLLTPLSIFNTNDGKYFNERMSEQPALLTHFTPTGDVTQEEMEALKFLYTYLPTPDLLEYNTEFHLANVRAALKAREEMPWGSTVPDREWRHFVLPVRINNENLDMSRQIFYDELKDRVSGLSMKDAILEVNHWCHEKVSYQPSDIRTSAPLATVMNALGRCGEESTFTVAALRSVGIPARQIYTPRWAHTDSNHAWVEAWADGKWYFLGACEPEPVLDMGWFNEPASRGMLMNTTAIGYYDGPEEVIVRDKIGTTINVTSNYAPVVKTSVVVTDADGTPVADADVDFGIYNDAEFYPVATRKTDHNGQASLTTGNGNMLVWAASGDKFGFARSVPGETVIVKLDKDSTFRGVVEIDIIPPGISGNRPHVSDSLISLNNQRKVTEDSIRMTYQSTFLNLHRAGEICDSLAISDPEAPQLLCNSRGNHRQIVAFLKSLPQDMRAKGVRLLASLSEKDLHDVTVDVLNDHISNTLALEEIVGLTDTAVYEQYLLSPRVSDEMLTAYKDYFRSQFSPSQQAQMRARPSDIPKILLERISPDDNYNTHLLYQSPATAWESGICNPGSLLVLFVAICRSVGIPARIDYVRDVTQFYDIKTGVWEDVILVESQPTRTASHPLQIDAPSHEGVEPKYYSQFAISQIVNGKPQLLEFDDFIPVSQLNKDKTLLPEGQYTLLTGRRLANGNVLTRIEFFGIGDNEDIPQLIIREDTTALSVIGSFNSENMFRPLDKSPLKTLLSVTGRGYYVLGILKGSHEPSSHAINDIGSVSKELDALGRPIVLLFESAETADTFRQEDYVALPECVTLGIDETGILKELAEDLELTSDELPIFIVADTFNRVVYITQGYNINLGDTLRETLSKLQ